MSSRSNCHRVFCLQVACMQFINIVVHSVENMNFRVHLQYEFTHLALDKYLEVSVHKNLKPGGVINIEKYIF